MDEANITARLLYRDASILVLDKPAGIAVHRERGGPRGETLTDWLDMLRFGLPRRPELAHRLDRDTSGCLVLGRHPRALARLSSLFATGGAEKLYWAVVQGVPDEREGTIDLPIAEDRRHFGPRRMRVDPAGKPASTHWSILATAGGRTWLALRPATGRTHQLRVHCAASGWPILGDVRYGGGPSPLMLHARRVSIPFRPGKPTIRVEAPAPEPMAETIATMVASTSPPSAGNT